MMPLALKVIETVLNSNLKSRSVFKTKLVGFEEMTANAQPAHRVLAEFESFLFHIDVLTWKGLPYRD